MADAGTPKAAETQPSPEEAPIVEASAGETGLPEPGLPGSDLPGSDLPEPDTSEARANADAARQRHQPPNDSRFRFATPWMPAWLLACLLVYVAVWTLSQGLTAAGLPLEFLSDFSAARLAEQPPSLRQAILLAWFSILPNQAFFYHLLIQSFLGLAVLFIWLIARRLLSSSAAYIALFSLMFLPIFSLTGAPDFDNTIVLLPFWFAACYALLRILVLPRAWAYALLAIAATLASLTSHAMLILAFGFLIWLLVSGVLQDCLRASFRGPQKRHQALIRLALLCLLPMGLLLVSDLLGTSLRFEWFDEASVDYLVTGGHFRALSVILVSLGTSAVGAILLRLRFRFRKQVWFDHPRLQRSYALNVLLLSGILALASWFVPPLYGLLWGAVQPLERLAVLVYACLPLVLLFWATNLPQQGVPLRQAGIALGTTCGFALAVGTANILLPSAVKLQTNPWPQIGRALSAASSREDRPRLPFLLLDKSLWVGAPFYYAGSSRLVAIEEATQRSDINADTAMAVCRNGSEACRTAIQVLGADRLLESLVITVVDPKDVARRADLMVIWPLPADGYQGLQPKAANPLSLLPPPKSGQDEPLPPGLKLSVPKL